MHSESPQTPQNIYRIGSAHGFSDLPHFWIHSLSEQDRLSTLTISSKELKSQYAINGPTECDKFDAKCTAKVAKIFSAALHQTDGILILDNIEQASIGNERHGPTLLQIMERKLADLRNETSIALKFLVFAVYYILVMDILSVVKVLTCLCVIAVVSTGRFRFIRDALHLTVIFFNPAIVPVNDSPLLLITPFLLIKDGSVFFLPYFIVFLPIILALLTNFVDSHANMRRLCFAYRAAILGSNLYLVTNVAYSGTYLQLFFILCSFHGYLISSISRIIIMLGFSFCALFLDIISAARGNIFARILFGCVSIWAVSIHMQSESSFFLNLSGIAFVISLSVILPDLLLDPILWLIHTAVDLFTMVLSVVQTSYAAIVMFSYSFSVGFKFLTYLRTRYRDRESKTNSD